MKVYIAGPMSSLPQNNFPAFDAAGAALRALGYEVVSPSELDNPAERALALADLPAISTWGDFLARDVKLIADSGVAGIVLLPGWQKSRGARLEAFVGLLCGLQFAVYDDGEVHPVDPSYVLHHIQVSFY